MDIGLFLDVDNTLTEGLIQDYFAKKLGVTREYSQIEDLFRANQITSTEFGRRIIRLFNSKGFTDKLAEECFGEINQTSWADELLNLPVTTYLVSSGPSYYVWRFAEQHKVPRNNVLCSIYRFGVDGKLATCTAVDSVAKRTFRERNSRKHFLTVGVGDSATHDGPFVAGCDIPILTVREPGYFYVDNLGTVREIVSTFSIRSGPIKRNKPTLFIGSSSERLDVAKWLYSSLEQICDPTVWDSGVFRPGQVYIEALENALKDFDFAAFIIAPDDIELMRGREKLAVRDNIIFEIGMFMGHLGRERCFLLYPRENKPIYQAI
ncbi:MAG: nucleotide-binding protein [Acetobacteraceae bacterium]|nr:nucleotide-binding protein [Acetobacteraceae bacterium]